MLRLFISCQIPTLPPLQRLHQQLTSLGGRLSPDPVANWHITLKFLGDTDAPLVPQIEDRLTVAAASTPCCRPRLRGLDAFPHRGRPSVVWVGVDDCQVLTELATRLEDGFQDLGFESERRPFQPHVTVLRVKTRPPQELFALFEEHRETDFGRFEVTRIELMRSEPGRRGARYTTLFRAPLATAGFDRSLPGSPQPT